MNTHEVDRIACAMHVARPDWPVAQLKTLIRDKLADRPRRDVFVALAWVASEAGSSSPYRVLETGPWWQAAGVDGQTTGRREPFDPTRFCGVCSKPDDVRHPQDHSFESVVNERRKDAPGRELVTNRVQRMRESIGDAKALREPETKREPLPPLPEVERLRAIARQSLEADDHATTKPDPEPLLTDAGSREPEPTTETEETTDA